jgi:transcriptional repressor NrdR
MVVKKDGRRETFERRKLLDGIRRACEKRPVSVEAIDHAVTHIEKRLQELCVKEVPAMKIGDFVMEELRGLDQIAYVRFASVYREFSDVSEFVSTLESLDSSSELVTHHSDQLQSVQPLKKVASDSA